MTKTTAIALLAALAACQPDLSNLEPKTAAECGADAKPCGWRCVPLDDPSTACAHTDSCSPCPVDQHEVGVCGPAGACQTICAEGWGDCNGNPDDGCERSLAEDEQNCGACSRVCDGTCTGGYCPPTAHASLGGNATGIALAPGGRIFALASSSGGSLHEIDPAGTGTATGVTDLGAVGRLEADPAATAVAPVLYAIGTNAVPQDVVWSIQVATSTKATVAPSAGVLGRPISDLAVGPVRLWYATPSLVDLFWVMKDLSVEASTFANDYGARSVTSVWLPDSDALTPNEWTYFTSPDRGGSVWRVSDGATPALEANPVATGQGSVFRIASHSFGNGTAMLAWTTLDDGGVTMMLAPDGPAVRIHATGVATQWMDVFVDGQGAYWTDLDAGVVGEVRYDSTRLALALGVAPISVVADGTSVWFTDWNGTVYRTPR
jgi:hypothetical protein